MWLTALKYIAVGILFWFIGTLFAGSADGFVKRSEPAQLIVLQFDSKIDADGPTKYRPVFGLDTADRPRPEYAGKIWVWPKPHKLGEVVSGRYDAQSGEMRSDKMIGRTSWSGRIAQVLGIIAALQGLLMLFGLPEILMPLRVRLGT